MKLTVDAKFYPGQVVYVPWVRSVNVETKCKHCKSNSHHLEQRVSVEKDKIYSVTAEFISMDYVCKEKCYSVRYQLLTGGIPYNQGTPNFYSTEEEAWDWLIEHGYKRP